MVAWMLYVTVVGSAMGIAGLLSERGLREMGGATRRAWIAAMAATIGLPLALAFGAGARWESAVGGGPLGSAGSRLVGPWGWSLPGELGSPTLDMVILAVWITLSLVLLGNVRLSAWTVRRNERSWRTESIGDERVLLSGGFGPGVIGATRPRIVLPEWVLAGAPSLRRLILVHEIEHVRARDTRLLLAGVILVVLVPWCIPLWWQLHRLRRAIETDCDARVVAATADARGYAHALVTVAGRRTGRLLPVATLAPGRGELERRLHLITAGSRQGSKLTGLGLLASAAVLVLVLSGFPVPPAPTPNLELGGEPVSWSVTAPVREATVILSVYGQESGDTISSE